MSHSVVTAGTGNVFRAAVNSARIDGVSDRLMTTSARGLGHASIELGDFYRVRVFAGSEIKRMKEAIAGFDRVFSDQIVRRMAVVASSRGMMAGLHPCFVLGAHGMTVRACCGIIEKVGITFRIQKRVTADSRAQADENRQNKRWQTDEFHCGDCNCRERELNEKLRHLRVAGVEQGSDGVADSREDQEQRLDSRDLEKLQYAVIDPGEDHPMATLLPRDVRRNQRSQPGGIDVGDFGQVEEHGGRGFATDSILK